MDIIAITILGKFRYCYDAGFLSRPRWLYMKKLLIIVQGKEQKFFEKEAERLRAVDIVGVASGESEGEEDQSLFDHLGNDLGAIGSGIGNFFALNEESYYDSDPNDDGDGERKVRPKMFKGTLSDSRVQANGKPFFVSTFSFL